MDHIIGSPDKKHVLLTGACGFVGKVLLPMLLDKGYRVTCVSSALAPTGVNDSTSEKPSWVSLDINNADAVNQVMQLAKPTHVIHLAAISHVPTSFNNPVATWKTNVIGTLNLLQAIKTYCSDAFFLFVSSSEVYGDSFKTAHPLSEDAKLQPMNPYAASKAAAELAVGQYFRQGGLGVIARPFNHIGPGQSPEFVTASFARQIAMIEANMQSPAMGVGNLEAQRDFLDVRDVCFAYLKLLELPDAKLSNLDERTFNIASGRPQAISAVLDLLLKQSSSTITVEQDPERMRPSDIALAAGNCDKLFAATGWLPQYNLKHTLKRLLDDWREQVKK
jgi:GDP-4-dehydro-6-deoxy-D-mannose reductase